MHEGGASRLPMSTTNIHPGTEPSNPHQVARSRARLVSSLPQRERRLEALAGALFLLAAIALVVLADPPAPDLGAVAVLVVAYAAAMRIEFEAGPAYTVPTVLVLIPMLYLLPAPLVPLCVVAAHLASFLFNVAVGRRHIARLPIVLGQGLHALGPAIVFTLGSPGAASWDDGPLVLGAFAAYVACDATTSLCIDHFGHREPLGPLLRSATWVYLVDLLLVPVGLMVAIAAGGEVAPIAILAPLCTLLAVFAGERRRRLDHAIELSKAYRGTALLLGEVIEHDDAYTGTHSRDVVDLALSVGGRLGLDESQMRRLEFGALLHDIGKIAVPKDILHKPGPLNAEEWQVMRRHTVEGQLMLEGLGGVLAEAGAIVRSSHERWDGAGYPDGIAREAIPIESRICAACDAFSAMTTDRPYRRAMSVELAVAELRAHAGTQFDPRVAEALSAELGAPEARAMLSVA
jgi:HD-GYP domain-containing protein (c-di-GMP phosphodiesterase class II)